MNITVKSQAFSLTPAVEVHVRERLERALAKFDDHVINVDVTLRDVNGPRGRSDKQMLVLIGLRRGRVVPLEVAHADMHTAIQRSADCAKRAVKRRLNKHRRINKRALRRLRLHSPAVPQPA